MKNEDKYKLENKKNKSEDATKYGEFIPTCFTWISINEQKRKTEEMENMTKKK